MIRIFSTVGVVATLVAGLAAAPAEAETGWLTDGVGGLYSLNTATAIASPVGSMAEPVGALAAFGASTMLGIQNGPGDEQHLVSIDLATATTTDRGLLDQADAWAGLTSTADGTLYATAVGVGQDVPLFTVDPADATMMPVGDDQPDLRYVALAGGCGDLLLGADDQGFLVKVDRASGGAQILAEFSTGGDAVVALAYDHAHRTVWAMTRNLSDEHLFRIDPATGVTTPTTYQPGQIGSGPIGLAFDSPSACRYQRKLSLGYASRTKKFTGRLTSSWQPCTASQKVSIYRKVKGPDDKLGTVTTGSGGKFKLKKALKHGSAYAVATKSSKASTGVCLSAKSGLTR